MTNKKKNLLPESLKLVFTLNNTEHNTNTNKYSSPELNPQNHVKLNSLKKN